MKAHPFGGAAACSQPLLIGLTGGPGTGKDTAAAILHRHGFASIAFADALYLEISEAFHLGMDMLKDRQTKEWPLAALAASQCRDARFIARMAELGHDLYEPRSARWVLQHWGTEYRRAQDSGYWLKAVGAWIQRQHASNQWRLVVTDVRMANEAALIGLCGGEVWRLHRPDAPALARDTAAHDSERQAAEIISDRVIDNAGSLYGLESELLAAVDGATRTAAAAREAA